MRQRTPSFSRAVGAVHGAPAAPRRCAGAAAASAASVGRLIAARARFRGPRRLAGGWHCTILDRISHASAELVRIVSRNIDLPQSHATNDPLRHNICRPVQHSSSLASDCGVLLQPFVTMDVSWWSNSARHHSPPRLRARAQAVRFSGRCTCGWWYSAAHTARSTPLLPRA